MKVITIGPPAGGKSTVSARLASRVGLPLDAFDTDPHRRYRPFGYTEARAEWWYQRGGAEALHRYQARFEARALRRAVESGEDGIVDASGGVLLQYADRDHTILESALELADIVIMACPSPGDPKQTCRVVLDRLRSRAANDPVMHDWLCRGGAELAYDLVDAAVDWLGKVHFIVDTSDGTWRLGEAASRQYEAECSRLG